MTTAAPYLRLTVLLNPAEDTGRQLLEARHRDGGIEGLEEGVLDALSQACHQQGQEAGEMDSWCHDVAD